MPGDDPAIARVQHPAKVFTVAASRDGRLAALGGYVTGTGASLAADVTLWDLEQGVQITRLAGLEGQVVCLAFSPDGARVAAANENQTLMVWDIQTGAVVARGKAKGRPGPAQIVFSADSVARLVGRQNSRSYSVDGRFLADIRTASAPLWNHKPYDYGPEVFFVDQADGSEVAALHLLKTDFKTWPDRTAWAPDGESIVVWSKQECGIWQPVEDRFTSQSVPVRRPGQYLYDVAVLPDLTLAYAIQDNHLLVIPGPDAERARPLLTPWARYNSAETRRRRSPSPVRNGNGVGAGRVSGVRMACESKGTISCGTRTPTTRTPAEARSSRVSRISSTVARRRSYRTMR